MKELMKIWRQSINWNAMSKQQRVLAVKFGVCVAITFCLVGTWIMIPFFILAIHYGMRVSKELDMIEE